MKTLDGNFLRPLVNLSKADAVHYLAARNLQWREDPSNQSRIYKRNKVRLDLVPVLTDLCGGGEALQSRLDELAEQSSDLKTWIRQQVSAHNRHCCRHCTVV